MWKPVRGEGGEERGGSYEECPWESKENRVAPTRVRQGKTTPRQGDAPEIVKQGGKVAIEREVGGDQRKSLEVQEMKPHGVVTVVMR